jgi:hypothetical protein
MRAYNSTDEALIDLRQECANFRQTFQSPTGAAVYGWLKDFCRQDKSCFNENPYAMAAMEGRRDVLIEINKRLNLTPEELFYALGGKAPAQQEQADG